MDHLSEAYRRMRDRWEFKAVLPISEHRVQANVRAIPFIVKGYLVVIHVRHPDTGFRSLGAPPKRMLSALGNSESVFGIAR
jgi:hypothetical protein